MITLLPATVDDGPAIDALLDACFGPARRQRTAYRLRDGVEPIAGLSLVARDGAALAGSIQFWPVALFAGGRAHRLTLLGPLAVAPDRRGEGLGAALLTAALAGVDTNGAGPVVLIGDEPYYGRFGFAASGTARWSLPGPVDRARLLLRGGAGLPGVARLGPVHSALPLAA